MAAIDAFFASKRGRALGTFVSLFKTAPDGQNWGNEPVTNVRLLSKSKLIAFRQCPKRLWLEVHRPDLREDSAAVQASFQAGYQVGEVARRLYDPEGQGALIDVESEGYDGAFGRTAELLSSSLAPIFEAGFRTDGALAFADVMLPERQNGQIVWRMVEVKASASVKDYHCDDIAIQAFVARSAGVNLKSVALAHIDSSWVYPGDEDYRGLLTENDLTTEAFARTDEVNGWVADAQGIVAQPGEPEQAVGPHCYDPFVCGFCNYCNRDAALPEYPIDWLPRLSPTKRETFAELGVDDLRGVPDDLLSDRQYMIKEHTLNKTVFFDVWLKTLRSIRAIRFGKSGRHSTLASVIGSCFAADVKPI